MSKIHIEPDDFNKQRNAYEKSSNAIESIKLDCDCSRLRLTSIDKFRDCTVLFNSTIEQLSNLLKMDSNALSRIMQEWQSLDKHLSVGFSSGGGTR